MFEKLTPQDIETYINLSNIELERLYRDLKLRNEDKKVRDDYYKIFALNNRLHERAVQLLINLQEDEEITEKN